jgi:stage II sporulation protein AA (anti-sigma F factor antagonist)
MTEVKVLIEDLVSPTPDKKLKIVHITGQLDESNVDEKIQEVYKVLEANPQNLDLIFDLENLEYMNSKSIGYLTDIYGKVTETNGKVVIAKARPNIADILQVVGLTQLVSLYDSIDSAKTALAS